jgi:hypothetical protein
MHRLLPIFIAALSAVSFVTPAVVRAEGDIVADFAALDSELVAQPHGGPEGWLPGEAATGSPRLRGAFDVGTGRTTTLGQPLTLNGWVGNLDDPKAIAELTIVEGQQTLAAATLGLPRTDQDPKLATSGFSALVDGFALQPGKHTLTAVARTTTNGSWTRSLEVDVAAPSPRPAGQFEYGTHVTGLDHASMARAAGFKLMWGYVPWQQVEPSRGDFLFRSQDQWGKPMPNALTNVVSAAADAGMKMILRVDEVPAWAGGHPANLNPADLEAYLYEVVRYGKGTIQYVEIFNEPNLPYEWGGPPDPAAYVRLLAAANRGVKRADPNVSVISAAVSQRTGGRGGTMEDVDWLDGLYKAGGRHYFDLLGMHAYLGSFAPETDPRTCSPMCFRDVERFRAVMERNGDGSKQAFLTEVGVLEKSTVDLGPYAWMQLPADVRADYLVRALQMANSTYPWIRGAMVYNFDAATVPWTPATSEKFWFSLLNANGSPRLALDKLVAARKDGRLT